MNKEQQAEVNREKGITKSENLCEKIMPQIKNE